jgi:electron transport complex protein RnfD
MSEENTPEIKMPDMSQVLVSPGPHIHTTETVPKFMFTVVIAMLPACLAGIWFFGFAALKVL